MPRFVAGRTVTLNHEFETESESLLSASSVTVTVRNAAGTTVSTGEALNDGNDKWFYEIPVSLAMGDYTAQWDAKDLDLIVFATDHTSFDVVGGRLLTFREIRNGDAELVDAGRYPPDELMEKLAVVEDDFERITGRSFIRRTRRLTVEHDADSMVTRFPVMDMYSVGAIVGPGDVAVDDADMVADADGFVTGWGALGAGPYSADVTYGFPTPPPGVKRAAILYLRHILAEEDSGIPQRTTSYQPESGGTYTFASTGETGLPEVDRVLKRYTYNIINSIFGGL